MIRSIRIFASVANIKKQIKKTKININMYMYSNTQGVSLLGGDRRHQSGRAQEEGIDEGGETEGGMGGEGGQEGGRGGGREGGKTGDKGRRGVFVDRCKRFCNFMKI